MHPEFLVFLITAVACLILWFRFISYTVIFEFQKGLMYKKGAFVKVLGPGMYRFLKRNTDIQIVDIRRALLSMPGQEILTKDNISLKLSLCGFFEITDPVKAKHQSQNYLNEFYNHAQVALRDVISSY